MKKIQKLILILIIASSLLGACDDKLLDLSPVSDINAENFYSNKEDMVNAVNAAYAGLRLNGLFNQGLYYLTEMRSDNTFASWVPGNSFDTESIYYFTVTSSNRFVNSVWNDSYEAILRCNVVLDRIDAVEMDQTFMEQLKGEVRFLRALEYFYLVELFGDVPLVLKELTVQEAYELARTPVQEVYNQIIEDLKFAENVLPPSYPDSDLGRATNGAAKGILGKVYLKLRNYADAKSKLEEVINYNQYALLPDYAQLWDLDHENSSESLFEVQYKKGGTGTGSPFANAFAPRGSGQTIVPVGGTGSVNSPTVDMANAYEPGDLRKDISMEPGFYDENGEFVPYMYPKKYLDVPFVSGDADNNWPVLRYADVLLMYAEVLNELGFVADGKAFELLNQIRERAGLEAKTSAHVNADLRITNQQEFRLAMEQERRVELAFENHRWFDLLRTGRALEVINSKRDILNIPNEVPEYQLLYPIPLQVIDNNPTVIQQNPGY
jgi:tetratricopeptide (TPR) repeat protein